VLGFFSPAVICNALEIWTTALRPLVSVPPALLPRSRAPGGVALGVVLVSLDAGRRAGAAPRA